MNTKPTISVLIAASLLLAYGLAEAIHIRGARSCGTWVTERSASTTRAEGHEGWLVGYLSGLAVATSKDVLPGTDNESLFLWMDNYCKANPLKNLHDGGYKLFYELASQKGLSK